MRGSQVNNWYKIQEVLDGLQGTASHEVELQLLRHLSTGHLQRFQQEGKQITVDAGADELIWCFRSSASATAFIKTVCDWFKSKSVFVPAH